MQLNDTTMTRLKYKPVYTIVYNPQAKKAERYELCRFDKAFRNGKQVPKSKLIYATHSENQPWLESECNRLNQEAREYFAKERKI